MCVVSNVFDHYDPIIPDLQPFQPVTPFIPTAPLGQQQEWDKVIDELNKQVESFRRAKAAAEVVDEETGQKDCVDPEKAKLLQRIEELEKIIANPPEFIIIKGGNLEPGKYCVRDGKLYKVIE